MVKTTPLRWTQPETAGRTTLFALLITIVGLFPRLTNLTDFFTTDEAYHWIDRVAGFSTALQTGNLIKTSQTGHPGVTIMWLGTFGSWAEQFAVNNGWVPQPDALTHLAWLRAPHALLEVLLLPVMYLLLRRLVTPLAALVGGLLIALSPYLIAHARLLHLDALLTSFVTISLLFLLISLRPETQRERATLLASGMFAGLALLTKGPALILLPFAGLTMFAPIARQFWQRWRGGHRLELVPSIRDLLLRYFSWLLIALVVVVVLWPALWVDPPGIVANYIEEIRGNGSSPNGDGQFFMGHAIADPGMWFYVVTDAFRATPALSLGVLLFPLAFVVGGSRQRVMLLALLAFFAFWTLVMTIGPKKFDRYTLPTWPALLALGGAGLAALPQFALRMRVNWLRWPATALASIIIIAVLVIDGIGMWQVRPYFLSYYNPLLGGGKTAQHNLLIGWGEGMDQVGAALNTLPNPGNAPVLSTLGVTLRPFSDVPVLPVERFGQVNASYTVVYTESIQRAADPPLYTMIRQTVPLETIEINGITYATIHQVPPPIGTPLEAQFGPELHLRGYTIERNPEQLIVTLAWDVRAKPEANLLIFLHVLDANGNKVAQVDLPPGGGNDPGTPTWRAGQQIAVPIGIGLPAGLPAGQYRLVMGLYDQQSGQRLPFTGQPAADQALDGPAVLQIETFTLGATP